MKKTIFDSLVSQFGSILLLTITLVCSQLLCTEMLLAQDTINRSKTTFRNTSNSGQTDDETNEPAIERAFKFNYSVSVKDVPAGSDVRVWVPIAQPDIEQEIELAHSDTPSKMVFHYDQEYFNRIGFFQVKSNGNPISFTNTYEVNRKEAGVDSQSKTLTAEQKAPFLQPDALVPITGEPVRLLEKQTLPSDPLAAGRMMYEIVDNHMKYDKSKPGYGKGDSVWACDSKTGNCTDFHSLFISLARSRSVPAKFEIGFPIGTDEQGEVKGYHCWAWFHVDGKGWMPVDISEADKHPELKEFYFGHLTADRVAFTTGRDIELIPESNSGPLNYFIYPHVEVDGKQWPKEKIDLKFSYQNNK